MICAKLSRTFCVFVSLYEERVDLNVVEILLAFVLKRF